MKSKTVIWLLSGLALTLALVLGVVLNRPSGNASTNEPRPDGQVTEDFRDKAAAIEMIRGYERMYRQETDMRRQFALLSLVRDEVSRFDRPDEIPDDIVPFVNLAFQAGGIEAQGR
jgi:hypothetical protein